MHWHHIATNAGVTTEANDPTAPYAVPTLTISTLYHAATAFFCYARYSTTGSAAFALGSVGSGSLASIGLWCILFASSSGRISRKTGADKRTSNFPFKNSEAASTKKRQLGKAIWRDVGHGTGWEHILHNCYQQMASEIYGVLYYVNTNLCPICRTCRIAAFKSDSILFWDLSIVGLDEHGQEGKQKRAIKLINYMEYLRYLWINYCCFSKGCS